MKTSLTVKEKAIKKSYEKGEWKSLGARERRGYVRLAKRQLKQERVNVRLSAEVLQKIRQDAEGEGIPYQTLISSVLYRYTHGRLHDEKYLTEALRFFKDP